MKSKHYTGGGYLENSSTCAGCHTTEGFIQFSRGQNITGHPNALSLRMLHLSFTTLPC